MTALPLQLLKRIAASKRIIIKPLILSVCILICSLFYLAGCSQSDEVVSGDVIIKSKDGQRIKPGLVEVSIFPDSIIKPFLQRKYEGAQTSIDHVKMRMDKWTKNGGYEELAVLKKRGGLQMEKERDLLKRNE